jgi:DNA-binding transcriptional regulator YbjK
LISRYERYIACARQPALRKIQRRNMRQRADAIAEAIERSGRSVRIELVSNLICAVDGAVICALVEDEPVPRTAARATLIEIIDVLAPHDHQAVHI